MSGIPSYDPSTKPGPRPPSVGPAVENPLVTKLKNAHREIMKDELFDINVSYLLRVSIFSSEIPIEDKINYVEALKYKELEVRTPEQESLIQKMDQKFEEANSSERILYKALEYQFLYSKLKGGRPLFYSNEELAQDTTRIASPRRVQEALENADRRCELFLGLNGGSPTGHAKVEKNAAGLGAAGESDPEHGMIELNNGSVNYEYTTLRGVVRRTNEDAHTCTSFYFVEKGHMKKAALFGVFDGHGGDEVATELSQSLYRILQDEIYIQLRSTEDHDTAIYNALKISFAKLNERIKQNPSLSRIGSCANIILMIDNELWCANVGDSRAVLVRSNQGKLLSADHNAFNQIRSVQRRGGEVRNNRIGGRLQPGRAFGDAFIKGIKARPSITKTLLEPGDVALIGCDGLWDVKSTDDVMISLRDGITARQLVHAAFNSGSIDNISALRVKYDRVQSESSE